MFYSIRIRVLVQVKLLKLEKTTAILSPGITQ